MNKPCEHCNKADSKKEGYFKCQSPCMQAKECYESDKIMFDILQGIQVQSAEKLKEGKEKAFANYKLASIVQKECDG